MRLLTITLANSPALAARGGRLRRIAAADPEAKRRLWFIGLDPRIAFARKLNVHQLN